MVDQWGTDKGGDGNTRSRQYLHYVAGLWLLAAKYAGGGGAMDGLICWLMEIRPIIHFQRLRTSPTENRDAYISYPTGTEMADSRRLGVFMLDI